MSSTTTAGRVRKTVAVAPITATRLSQLATGQRGMGELIDDMVQERAALGPLYKRLTRLADRMDRTDAIVLQALRALERAGLVELNRV